MDTGVTVAPRSRCLKGHASLPHTVFYTYEAKQWETPMKTGFSHCISSFRCPTVLGSAEHAEQCGGSAGSAGSRCVGQCGHPQVLAVAPTPPFSGIHQSPETPGNLPDIVGLVLG